MDAVIGSGRAAAEMALVSLRSSQVKQLARRAGAVRTMAKYHVRRTLLAQ